MAVSVMLTGCGGDNQSAATDTKSEETQAAATAETKETAENEEVTLTLGIWPEDTLTDDIQVHEGYVAAMKELHPNVTCVPAYYKYATDTFMPMVESGNCPTIFETWFTEPQKLIKAGAIADITDELEARGWLDKMNPSIKSLLSDSNGRVYGIPRDGYALGLLLKDWYVLRKQAWAYLIIVLVWGAIPSEVLNLLAVVYGAMIPYTAMAYDQQSRWNTFARMLPYREKDIVLSRYVLGWLCTAVGGAAVLVFQNVLSLFSPRFGCSPWTVLAASCVGLIIYFSAKVKNNVMLLIIGIMIGYLASSVISILNYYSSTDRVHAFVMWGLGNFSGVSLEQLPFFGTCALIGLLLAILLIKPLNALLLGEMYAANLGIRIKRTRIAILLCTGVLTATTTAFCGPISFVGLAVPHIARLMLGSSNHKMLVPVTMLTGSCVALLCNMLMVVPGSNTILPLNAVTPMLGAPVIIYVIVNRKNIQYFN